MPKILVFMSKIRKMFLNWTADYVICCRKSQVLISIQIFIVIQIFPILTVERGGSVNEIKNERHFTHVYKLIYIWKIQTNHCVIIKIVSHLLAFTFFFFFFFCWTLHSSLKVASLFWVQENPDENNIWGPIQRLSLFILLSVPEHLTRCVLTAPDFPQLAKKKGKLS
jgi:hypothetical protein